MSPLGGASLPNFPSIYFALEPLSDLEPAFASLILQSLLHFTDPHSSTIQSSTMAMVNKELKAHVATLQNIANKPEAVDQVLAVLKALNQGASPSENDLRVSSNFSTSACLKCSPT